MTKNIFLQFFQLCETFFRNFLNVSKGSPFILFLRDGCSKTPKGLPFTFFGTMRLTGDQKNSTKNFKKIGISFQFFPHAGTVEEIT